MGQKIVILNPFHWMAAQGEPLHGVRFDTFNALDFIDGSSRLVLDEVRSMASALVVRTGKESEPHWNDSAEVWISAMATTVAVFGKGEKRSLQAVRLLLTDPVRMAAAVEMMSTSDACAGDALQAREPVEALPEQGTEFGPDDDEP